jgi:hypothetical protein
MRANANFFFAAPGHALKRLKCDESRPPLALQKLFDLCLIFGFDDQAYLRRRDFCLRDR